MSETYTKRQLLIALLVPIFSCLTVAISFTTALLVRSVRRVGQPFKLASRYGRTKRQRKPTNWDMVDILRRASLTRRGSRLKTRPSAPSIEITKAEDRNGTIFANNESKRKVNPWYERGKDKETRHLHVQEARRRSSNSSGNSSLYELLARLNRMDFETCITDNGTELKELAVHKNGVKPVLTEHGPSVGEEDKQLVEKRLKAVASINGEANMAFRDSVVSVETNGSGVAKVTSVQQVNQRDSIGRLEDIHNVKSDTEHREVGQSSRDDPIESPCDRSSDENDREETESGKNIQTVTADVHNSVNYAGTTTANESIENHEKKPPSKGKVVWTYSL